MPIKKGDAKSPKTVKASSSPRLESYREFRSRVTKKEFDVGWVISRITSADDAPWFKHLLMIMLIGWIFDEKNLRVRKSFAWHQVNARIHTTILKAIAPRPSDLDAHVLRPELEAIGWVSL
jgi:hypothetical protein